jgi:hypothetical protein
LPFYEVGARPVEWGSTTVQMLAESAGCAGAASMFPSLEPRRGDAYVTTR